MVIRNLSFRSGYQRIFGSNNIGARKRKVANIQNADDSVFGLSDINNRNQLLLNIMFVRVAWGVLKENGL